MIEGRLPADTDGPAEIQLQESRQEIASRLSMKPETLSRILRTLSDSGAISVQGRVLRVPSRRQLLAILDTTA
jgi:CRP-like cAMP-binding protein